MVMLAAVPFASSMDQLLAEVQRVEVLMRAAVERVRSRLPSRGPALPEGAVTVDGSEGGESSPGAAPEVELDRSALTARVQASLDRGIELRLPRLVRAFGLTPLETDALLLCLAPEVDQRYGQLCAEARGDAQRARPSIDLVLTLLARDDLHKLQIRQLFARGSALLRQRLLTVLPAEPAQPAFLGAELAVDARVVAFLTGSDELAECLEGCARHRPSSRATPDLLLAECTRAALERLRARPAAISLFDGPPGVGKRSAAAAWAAQLAKGLLVVASSSLCHLSAAELAERAALASREALLLDAVLYWDEFECWLDGSKRAHLGPLLDALANGGALVVLGSSQPFEPSGDQRALDIRCVDFPALSSASRAVLWRTALAGVPHDAAPLETLASQFEFNATQLMDAAASARQRAFERGDGRVSSADLLSACRRHSHGGLARLASKIEPRFGWDDIVLASDQRDQLLELCSRAKHRGKVLDEWGFGHKVARGRGLCALFAGPSGTGKTMAAEVVAHELGCDLYKIDLATVVSKYIGETEKNLSQVFEEAERSHSILFFDEADALFGKRSEVKDAHDRYANLEVSYLLQRMEAFSGTSILATNARKNLDAAFTRRLAFCIHFEPPDVAQRRRIWESIWPVSVPRAPSLDLAGVSERFELSGGNIKNVALASAFAAASNGQVVTTEHVIRAVRREYQKLGKLCVQAEFGPYFALLGEGPREQHGERLRDSGVA
jgi:SpoVK/Ycf46/Vps4 family AAA+-type ATPase